MAAYLVAFVEIKKPETFGAYVAKSSAIIAEFGGKILARGGETVTLEGEPFSGRAVLIEFPSLDQIKAFYTSASYQEAKRLRDGIATARLIGLQGLPITARSKGSHV
jgi:uncharacterized protein (DUF1330 family)